MKYSNDIFNENEGKSMPILQKIACFCIITVSVILVFRILFNLNTVTKAIADAISVLLSIGLFILPAFIVLFLIIHRWHRHWWF